MKKIGGETIRQIILTTLCFAGIFVCTQYLEILNSDWRLILTIAAALLYAVYLLCELMGWGTPAKLILSLSLVAVILEAIVIILVRAGVWEHFSDAESMRQFISSTDNYYAMVLIFIAIQFAQVCLIPIPGAVTTAAGALLFGPLLGSLYSFIGILLGSVTAFLVGRKFGYRLVRWIVGEDDLKKGLKFVEGRDRVMFFLIFLLPFFPDDVLCFVAGLTPMSLGWFVLLLTVARIVTILCTAYVVEYVRLLFAYNSILAIVLCAVVIAGMVMLFIYGVKYGKQIETWCTKKAAQWKKKRAKKAREKAQAKDE